MLPLFTKAAHQVSAEDINELVTEEMPESQTVEYKQTLSTRDGSPDRWITSGDRVGDRARDEVLEQVVAFANSGGGNLILGIEETADQPSRAAGVTPLPNCHELADRLRRAARDCIDPPLPSVEIFGVETAKKSKGGGVVMFRIPGSRLGPHRLIATLQCYRRHADQTEKMTMREIQDMAVDLSRGSETINAVFEERCNRFADLATPAGRYGEYETGIRATAVPIGGSIYIEKPYARSELHALLVKIRTELILPQEAGAWDTHLPYGNSLTQKSFRPILMGTRREEGRASGIAVEEIRRDGLVEFVFKHTEEEKVIYRSWVIAMAANALCVADIARVLGGSPGAELILDVEIGCDHYVTPSQSELSHFMISGWNGSEHDFYTAGPEPLCLPRLSAGARDEFPTVLRALLNNLLNAVGLEDVAGFDVNLG